MFHFEPSTGVPAGALNSSENVVARTPASPAGAAAAVGWPAGVATAASVANPAARASRTRDRREGCVDIFVTADARLLLLTTKGAMVQTNSTRPSAEPVPCLDVKRSL